ncbi:MAG: Uma2 family endonuclease [Janthinobacterium lividum]
MATTPPTTAIGFNSPPPKGYPSLSPRGYPLRASERYIPVEKYLRTTYHPDRDYVDGHLEIRNTGNWEHGDLQSALVAYLRTHAREWGIYAVAECRLQVKPDNFRIPDVMVVSREKKPELIIRDAPLLCIEVLSPDDTVKRIMCRVEDYIAMGVKAVWVLEPKRSEVLVVSRTESRWTDARVLTVEGTAIRVDLDEIAADLAD